MKKLPIVAGLLFIAILFITGCGDNNNDNNIITIEIISPIENGKVSDPAAVQIHVIMTATEELHEVEITLTEKSKDTVSIKNFSKYVHSKQFEYLETVDLSGYSPGTGFQLKTQGCANHECGQSLSKIIYFAI